MLIDRIAKYVLEKLSELGDVPEVIDYAVCYPYTYVVVYGSKGIALGVALTPIEDVLGAKIIPSRKPETGIVTSLVSSINPIEKSVGVALLNSLSSYLLWNLDYTGKVRILTSLDELITIIKEPILMVGNMAPLANYLRSKGFSSICIIERNPTLRCRTAYSDTAFLRLIADAKTIIATGATLVNDTIDMLLSMKCSHAKVILVGPTASVHPEPAIKEGIYSLVSLRFVKIDEAIEIIRLGGGRQDFSSFCEEYIVTKEVV